MARAKDGTQRARAVTPSVIALEERREAALKLAAEGWDQRAIAEHLSTSQATISRDIRKALRARQAKGVDELRALQDVQLELLTGAVMKSAIKGDPASVHAYVQLAKRKAALFGLDAEAQSRLNGAGAAGVRTVVVIVGVADEVMAAPHEGGPLAPLPDERQIVDAAVGTALAAIPQQADRPQFVVQLLPQSMVEAV